MQVITTWADIEAISAPKHLIQALLKHLIKPFTDEISAKAFWESCGGVLYVVEACDGLESLADLESSQQRQVQFALECPEYREVLVDGYIIQLAIVNDEGAGVYLIINSDSALMHSDVDATAQ